MKKATGIKILKTIISEDRIIWKYKSKNGRGEFLFVCNFSSVRILGRPAGLGTFGGVKYRT